MADIVEKIEIKRIEGTDVIGNSRLTINNNFQILADAINVLEGFLDTDERTLTNIKSLVIYSQGVKSTTEIISISLFSCFLICSRIISS